jgi:cytochrome-b5 reductase
MRQALRFSAPAALLCAAARAAQWSVSADASAANPLAPPPPALSPSAFRAFRVARVAQLTHDTRRITVAFPSESDVSGASAASCLVIKATVDGKDVVRPYTPTSPGSQRGTLDLIIKSYPNGTVSKCVAGRWGRPARARSCLSTGSRPPVSHCPRSPHTLTHLLPPHPPPPPPAAPRAMGQVKAGDSLELKGPFQKFTYEANQWASVGMIAGGTGITPMYQMLLEILSNPRDKTEVRLVYGCRTEEDIILRQELDALAVAYPNFKVVYTLSKPSAAWGGATGHVNAALLASVLPPPQEKAATKILISGPPAFMAALSGDKKSPSDQGELQGALKQLKYEPSQVFKY